jgi:hypothetical protein
MLLKTLSRLPVVLGCLVSLVLVAPAVAADVATTEEAGPMLDADEFEGLGAENPSETAPPEKATLVTGSAYLGQSFISRNEAGVRAHPYTYLRPGLVGGGTLTRLGRSYTVDLEGNYLSDKDNQGSMSVDFGGRYRFLLQTETLYHAFAPLPFTWDAVTLSNGNGVWYDQTPTTATSYGLKVRQDRLSLRAKPTDFPFHVDLGFRKFSKDGTTQLRFADVAFSSTNADPAAPRNTVFNRARAVDMAVYEGTAGVDAHLGYVDFVNQFQIRHFVDNQGIPQMANFQAQSNTSGPLRTSGAFQHNENPDSRFWSNTMRMHTSLSGGLVGALSYSYGQELSFSRLTDISGVSEAATSVRNMACDITYTPRPEFSTSLKYRRQIIEHDVPLSVVRQPSGGAIAAAGDEITTPLPVDSRRESLTATLLYRPVSILMLKGELKGDFVRRQVDANGPILPRMTSGHEERYEGKAAVIATPVKGLRLRGQYGYSSVSNPVYGTTFDDRHQTELIATYNRSNAFGTSVSGKYVRGTAASARMDQTSFTTSGWLNPLPMLTLNLSFAYLQMATDRTVRYATSTGNVPGAAAYLAQSHIYGVNAMLHLTQRMDLSAGYQQVRGSSAFTPEDQTLQLTVTTTGDTSGIADISRTHGVEHEVTSRFDYRLTDTIQTSVEYLYRVAYDHTIAAYDGGAHQIVATLGVKW